VEYGQRFQRIICITGPCISVTMIIITLFQSVGIKARPLVLSLLRKGGLDIPFMFLLNALLGVNGIVWATPIADCSAMLGGNRTVSSLLEKDEVRTVKVHPASSKKG
jgi:Na+-driven multidrug efflux pump